MIYLIGSLRNPGVPILASRLRSEGYTVFDDWYAAGPEADDYWQRYESSRGRTYQEALDSPHATDVFEFDTKWLDAASAGVLVMPAGRSAHLELGTKILGEGKPGYILLSPEGELDKSWYWVAGIYEGEGSISFNRGRGGEPKNLVLSVSSCDRDVIERLQSTTGVGRIQGPYTRNRANNLKKQPAVIKPLWRWAVYRKDDILFVLNGLFPMLSSRRCSQVEGTIRKVGLEMADLDDADSPRALRYDVMYKFATRVCETEEELLSCLQKSQ